jgi:hypothetical protein
MCEPPVNKWLKKTSRLFVLNARPGFVKKDRTCARAIFPSGRSLRFSGRLVLLLFMLFPARPHGLEVSEGGMAEGGQVDVGEQKGDEHASQQKVRPGDEFDAAEK